MTRVLTVIGVIAFVSLFVVLISDGDDTIVTGEGGAVSDMPAAQPNEAEAKEPSEAKKGVAAPAETQRQPVSAKPSTTCGEPTKAPDAQAVAPPPVPDVTAAREGDAARVQVRFRATPAECRPAVVDVRIARAGEATGEASAGLIPVQGSGGSILVELPPNSGPPYEARVIALTVTGARSGTVRVPVN